MEVAKCLGAVLLVLLFACHAYFYQVYFQEHAGLGELRLSGDVTPAARIRETFAMFVPGDIRRMHDAVRPLAKPQT